MPNAIFTRLTTSGTRLAIGEYEFSCGEPIVVLIADVEVSGWLEYSHNDFAGYRGWYLVGRSGGSWCPVREGMLARRGWE